MFFDVFLQFSMWIWTTSREKEGGWGVGREKKRYTKDEIELKKTLLNSRKYNRNQFAVYNLLVRVKK